MAVRSSACTTLRLISGPHRKHGAARRRTAKSHCARPSSVPPFLRGEAMNRAMNVTRGAGLLSAFSDRAPRVRSRRGWANATCGALTNVALGEGDRKRGMRRF